MVEKLAYLCTYVCYRTCVRVFDIVSNFAPGWCTTHHQKLEITQKPLITITSNQKWFLATKSTHF